MSFLETVEKARAFLERNGRVSLSALRLEFGLDESQLATLVEELVEIQRVAARDGRALDWAGRAPRAPPERLERGRATADYTPKHLADKILQSRSAVEGERKQVTVLFADVARSMELAEVMDPEEWHAILDRLFQILAEGVHQFEGTVNQYTGDGIMALFGAPLAHEDHAQRACYAALRLRDELPELADQVRASHRLKFSVRIGLNSGVVVAGRIGDDLRMDYTAQGHVVSLAARMEQIAEPGKAYLTEHTARLVEGFFELRDLGQTQIKGVRKPIGVYELEGLAGFRTLLEVSRSRGFSRFVGRVHEMQTLETALARTHESQGMVLGVVGDAGVGKSRLCAEFTYRARNRGTAVYEAHCPAHGKTVSLLPILDLLRSSFGIRIQDRAQEARDKIEGCLLLLDESFCETLPLVFDFLGVADPERPTPQIDPKARQHQLFAFLRRFVRARSEREAAVLLVDDMHWIDTGSEAFLSQLAEAVAGTRTLLLVNFRPEYHPDWAARSGYQQLRLSPLAANAIRDLLHALLGDDPTVADLRDLIRERTGGNPFFIEEVVRSLVEFGSLEGTPGSYRLVEPIGALDVPTRVQSVLAARVDRLGEREKQVLQTAAVVGKSFSQAVIARVTEFSDHELAAALRHLRDAEFINEEVLHLEVKYSFKHPLTREVAYETQLLGRRRQIHAVVACALVELSADKLDENAALIAYHFGEAGEVLSAARWHRRAAEWVGLNDVAEALGHWPRVLELVEGLPDAEAADLGLEACSRLLNLGGHQGLDADSSANLLRRGRQFAERGTNPEGLPRVLLGYGLARSRAGELSESLQAMRESEALARMLADPALGLETSLMLGLTLWSLGRLRESAATYGRVVAERCEKFSETLGAPVDVCAAFLLAATLFEVGKFSESADALAASRDLSSGMKLGAYAECVTLMTECRLLAYQGDLDRGLSMAGNMVELAQGSHNANVTAVALLDMGEIRGLCGKWREASAALEASLSVARQSGTMLNLEARALVHLARAKLGLGWRNEALATAEEAIAIAQMRGTRHHEAHGRIMYADTLLATSGIERLDEIKRAHSHAEQLIAETEAALIAPNLCESRAALARLCEDEAGCERELREAHRLYDEMGAKRLAAEVGE